MSCLISFVKCLICSKLIEFILFSGRVMTYRDTNSQSVEIFQKQPLLIDYSSLQIIWWEVYHVWPIKTTHQFFIMTYDANSIATTLTRVNMIENSRHRLICLLKCLLLQLLTASLKSNPCFCQFLCFIFIFAKLL